MGFAVPFQQIPQTLRTPLFFAEVSNAYANTNQQAARALLIGGVTAAGSAFVNAGLPVLAAGQNNPGAALAGPGSQLDTMNAAYRVNDPFGEMWFLPIADDPAGVAASGTFTFTGPATGAGTLALYVGSTLIEVPVASGTTAAAIATAVVAAFNATFPALPVTAAVAGAVVTVTARNLGLGGNDIGLRVNYVGSPAGQVLPQGVGVTIVGMSGGANNPVTGLTAGLVNLAALPFDCIACAFNDAASIAAITAFLSDTSGRWSWETQIFGHCFYAYKGTAAALTTFGQALNDQHASVMGVHQSPTPTYAWAAALCAAAVVSLRADPAQPLQTVPILGVLADTSSNQFNLPTRNGLLYDGISTYTVNRASQSFIERLITTYQLNNYGVPDDSYLAVETMFTLMTVLRNLKSIVTSKYARMKLAADGTPFAPSSNIVTPSIVRGDLIAAYYEMEYQGLVQQGDVFAKNLVVEQNGTNPNRLDVLWPGILIDQLNIFALLAQFRLS